MTEGAREHVKSAGFDSLKSISQSEKCGPANLRVTFKEGGTIKVIIKNIIRSIMPAEPISALPSYYRQDLRCKHGKCLRNHWQYNSAHSAISLIMMKTLCNNSMIETEGCRLKT